MRRNIVAAMQPMRASAQDNARSIPAHGPKSTGLRASLAAATKTRVALGARVTRVRLITDGKLMPAGQASLPTLMEGKKRWRHPVPHGNSNTWVSQDAHPYMAPAVARHLPTVGRAVAAAVDETAAKLSKG